MGDNSLRKQHRFEWRFFESRAMTDDDDFSAINRLDNALFKNSKLRQCTISNFFSCSVVLLVISLPFCIVLLFIMNEFQSGKKP